MLQLIPRRARINDVLSLRRLIERSRDDIVRTRHLLAELRTLTRTAELALGTADAEFDSIVAIYNRLVVEYEPQEKKRR